MKQFTKELYEGFVKYKKHIIIFLVVLFSFCIAGMITAGFFDLQLSQSVNNPNEWLSKLMSDYGEWPAYLINVGFFIVLFVWLIRHKKYWWSIVPFIAAAIFGYLFSANWFEITSLPILFNILFNVLAIGGLSAFFFFIPKKLLDKFFFIFFVAMILSTVTSLVMLLFKIFWGRVRFRNLDGNFTPWWLPNGITGHRSFFSGHVNTACCLMVLWFVPSIFGIKNPFARAFLFIIPVIYLLLMMYARIVVGAHYLSDTVFAVMHFTLWTIFIMRLLCKPKEKKQK